MLKFSDFYDTIDDIAEHCRMDLIGSIEENEVIEIEDPLSRYSLGILWALPKEKGSEPIEITNSLEEMFEDDLEENENLKNSSVFKPSSMGISCTVSEQDELEISFTYAIYHHSEQMIEEDGKNFKRHYSREPQKFSVIVSVPNQISNRKISNDEKNILIYLYVRKINDDGSKLVTISVLNRNRTGTEFIETNTTALFQCQLSVKSQKGFLPVYKRNIHRSFEEEKNDMLYDSINNYSYGHGCSSIHVENEGIVTEIRSEFIPQYRMFQMMPRLFGNAEYFYMKYWENPDRNIACETLHHFIAQYEEWFSQLQTQTELIQKYPEPAKHSFANTQKCIERLHSGVNILQNHDTTWKAFLYMNEAMLLQRIHTKPNSSPDTVSWYPFQLAYILQIIPDIVNYESPFHEVVDLLWFPTGGGKTEAYLGLSAFTIFYRRLNHETSNPNGVTIIMRYTLRLLTLQQFERATALVCACEHMRRKYHISGEEISIGLWIGSGMTPNHIKDATETLKKIKEDSTVPIFEANPMQITECPWCKTKIGVGGYEIELETMNISCCNNPKCEFHKHLPIYVIDDDIYQKAPTFILSTVDKFARITWEEKAGNLFGANGCQPPDLIIQDELHLISGSLGSITGIYEMAVEEICRHYGRTPKIIASTATVKNADKQIKILYNRNMVQFPPSGLSQKDSFFAVQADETQRPARTYVGICSIDAGTSEMLIKIFALLTFMKYLYQKQNRPTEVIDQYYTCITCIGYFNTLKELGSSSIMISDRILSEIRYLAMHKFQKRSRTISFACQRKRFRYSLLFEK